MTDLEGTLRLWLAGRFDHTDGVFTTDLDTMAREIASFIAERDAGLGSVAPPDPEVPADHPWRALGLNGAEANAVEALAAATDHRYTRDKIKTLTRAPASTPREAELVAALVTVAADRDTLELHHLSDNAMIKEAVEAAASSQLMINSLALQTALESVLLTLNALRADGPSPDVATLVRTTHEWLRTGALEDQIWCATHAPLVLATLLVKAGYATPSQLGVDPHTIINAALRVIENLPVRDPAGAPSE